MFRDFLNNEQELISFPLSKNTFVSKENEMIGSPDYREAMSLLTSAVSVVTTEGESGRYGLTVSAVCSVTDMPPTLLVCINRSASSHPHFLANRTLAVNVLNANQKNISQAFASNLTPLERFAQAEWTTLLSGAPVLQGALTCFDCEVQEHQEVGSHSILICRVVALKTGDHKQGLAYFNRTYHTVGQTVFA